MILLPKNTENCLKRKHLEMSEPVDPHTTSITIIANGQPRTVREGSTIADLLSELAIVSARVVAQLDGLIVPRSDFANAVLHEGCKLEIVTLVGGG